MNSVRPPRTRTEHELPFERLSPRDFERLCMELLEEEGYKDVQHLGASGRDGGIDITATWEGRRIGFQCKRFGIFGPKDAEQAVEKVLVRPKEEHPDELILLVSCSVSADARQRAQARAGSIPCRIWALTELDSRVSRYPRLRARFFDLGPLASSGATGAVTSPPKLPPHYRERSFYLENLKRVLLTDPGTRLAVTGAGYVGVPGMGGIGKSVLASAVAQDSEVRAAFPDGVFWVAMGRDVDCPGLLRELAACLGFSSTELTSPSQVRDRIRRRLEDLRILLILDDVWTLKDAETLDLTGPYSRILLTTRNAAILIGLGAQEICVDVLEPQEALELLAAWAGQDVSLLPEAAIHIIEECARLPLAVAMAGALVRKLSDWNDVLESLRLADLERLQTLFPEYKYPNLLRALGASVDALDPFDRERYFEFAVFPEDASIPEAAIMILWSAAGLSPAEVRRLLADLVALSLIRRDTGNRFVIHDLQRDYLRKHVSDLSVLHGRLIAAYASCCSHDFARGPNDGWFFQRLLWHLAEAGMKEELKRLLFSFQWLHAKLVATGLNSLLADFDRFANSPAARELQAALRLSAHVLTKDPDQLASQLLGRLSAEDAPGLDCVLEATKGWRGRWLRPLRPTLTPPGPLLRTLRARNSLMRFITLGGRLLVASTDQGLEVWDVGTGELLRTQDDVSDGLASLEPHLMTTLDTHRIAVGRRSGKPGVWDLRTDEWTDFPEPRFPMWRFLLRAGRLSRRVIRSRSGWWHSAVCMAAIGGHIALGLQDFSIWIMNIESGRVLILRGHAARLSDLAALDDHHLASASTDGLLKIWEIGMGKNVRTFKAEDVAGEVTLAVRDEKLVAASFPAQLHIWNWRTGKLLFHSPCADLAVYGLAWLDDERLASIGSGGSLRLRTFPEGSTIRFPSVHSAMPVGLASTSGGLLVSGSIDSLLRVWDLGRPVGLRPPSLKDSRVSRIAFLDERRAVCSWAQGKMWILEPSTGNLLPVPPGRQRRERFLAMLDADRLVLTAGLGAVQVFDKGARRIYRIGTRVDVTSAVVLDSRRVVLRSNKSVWIMNLETDRIRQIGSSPRGIQDMVVEGHWLVLTLGREILVRDLKGKSERVVTFDGAVTGVAPLGGGQLALCLNNKDLSIFDLASGALVSMWNGEPEGRSRIEQLIAVSNGRFASVSSTYALRLWSAGGEILAAFTFDVPPTAAAASPDGRMLVVGDENGRLHVLSLEEPSS